MSGKDEIRPFRVDVPQEEVDRLHRKLRDTRIPKREIVPGAGDKYGASLEWTTHLYSTWTESFSWHRQQDLINSLPQFTTEIEGLTVHFVHRRSPRPDASPLLLIHGWPGSFFEFHQIIQPLAEPDTNDVPAFHVVVPSLPGFCFSSPPPRPGWHPGRDNARIFHGLMRRLGYADGGYVVQAGDWGQFAARELGSKYTAEPAGGGCRAVHLNWCPGPLPSSEDTTDREKKVEGRVKDWLENHLGYAVMMRSRPHTVGWMLQDNPVGIMVFVGEKYIELSNPAVHSHPDWLTHILTTVCLYYFSNCIMTSALPYYDGPRHESFAIWNSAPENRIRSPLAFTSFFWDSRPSGRKGVEKTGNLVWYRERDEAGHFACLEDPEGMIQDLREFFAGVLQGKYQAEK